MNIVWIVVHIIFASMAAMPAMHFLQLLSYRPERGYNRIVRLRELSLNTALCLIYAAALLVVGQPAVWAFVPIDIVYLVYVYRKPRKPPYKRTKRMLRQTVTNAVIIALLCIVFLPLGQLLCYLVPLVSLLVNKPLERTISQSYINRAKKKLCQSSALRVVITGSYGKTTVKNYLKTLLEGRFNVLATPESYNTPLGIALTVNNSLNESTEIFIAEAGARQRGDIEEICEIVKPDIGIITGIAPQHLQTFGSLENILSTKLELFDYLSKNQCNARKPYNYRYCQRDGKHYNIKNTMIFGCDSKELCSEIERRGFSVLSCGRSESADVWVRLKNENAGCKIIEQIDLSKGLECVFGFGERVLSGSCGVFGEGELSSLALAAGGAMSLGLTAEEIVRAVKNTRPIEHRGSVISSGGLLIIDDSYNCSTVSAELSLRKLYRLGNRRFCITSGIVECGDMEVAVNKTLGKRLAEVCDGVCLVGRNSAAIYDGLIEKGYKSDRIFFADSPQKGVEALKPLLNAGDALLFLNDLPDNYI